MSQGIGWTTRLRGSRALGLGWLMLCTLLAGVAEGQAKYAIRGTLTSISDGAAIAHAHVTATAPDENGCSHETPAATTDDLGHFSLSLPCGGHWHLSAEATGFPVQEYEQHGSFSTQIVLTATQPVIELAFRLVPHCGLAGIVLDEAGEPVSEAQVTLLDVSADPPRPIVTITTDDRGTYEFANLVPGSYQVAVHTQPWYASAAHAGFAGGAQSGSSTAASLDPSLDMTYPITYYPGVTDASAATTLELTGGATQQADLHLSPVPSIHITVPGTGLGYSANDGAGRGGRFRRAPNIPPIQQISPAGETYFQPTSTTVNEDGSIDIGGFSPGTYTIAVDGRGRARSDQIQDQQVFTLARDPGHTVAINPANLPAQTQPVEPKNHLAGVAMRDTKAVPGALLLLVSAVNGAGPVRVRRQQSATDGSFLFEHLPAGNYILVAIEDGWRLNLADPAIVASYLLHGTPIHLTASLTLGRPVLTQVVP